MSLSNYYENEIGSYIAGITSAPSLGASRYLALLNITADDYPPYDPMNPAMGPEAMDPPAELFNTDLTDSGIECEDAGYARQLITFTQSLFMAGPDILPGQFVSSSAISFPAAIDGYDVTHFAVTNAATGPAKILFWGQFALQFDMQTYQTIPLTVAVGDTLEIPASGIQLGLQ